MRLRSRILLGVGVAALLLLGAAGIYLVPRRAALRCLLAFTEEVPAEGTQPEGFDRVRDAARLGVADAWIARPSGDGPHPLLLFVAGIAPKGLGDGRIVRAVDAFRRAGFLVVAPLVPGLVDPGTPDPDMESLGRLLVALDRGAVADAAAAPLGVVAISVGAPYALRVLAAHVAGGGRRPGAFLAIGAPADFDRCARRWFDTPRLGKEKPENQEDELRHAGDLGRNMLWRAAARHLVPDAADARRLGAWLTQRWVPEQAPEGLATDAGRAYAAMVLGPPEGWRVRRDEVLGASAPWTTWLSPVRFRGELEPLGDLPVYLLHGDSDPLVPASELQPLAELLGARMRVTTLRSHMVSHTDVDDVGLGERLAHLDFMDAFFDEITE